MKLDAGNPFMVESDHKGNSPFIYTTIDLELWLMPPHHLSKAFYVRFYIKTPDLQLLHNTKESWENKEIPTPKTWAGLQIL